MGFQFLSPETPIEQTYFQIPKFALSVVGCWPSQYPPVFSSVLQFVVNSLAVALGAFGECICGVLTLNELLESMEAWCPGITKQICLYKMWIFFVYREKLYSLIHRIEKLLIEDNNGEKRRIAQELSASASVLAALLFFSGNSTNLFFNLRPLVNNAILVWNGQNATLELPFKVILPDIFTHYPLYPITYLCLAYSGLMTVFTFSGVDGCFVGLCFYICALFKMIQYDVREVFSHLQDQDKAHMQDNRVVRQKLKVIIRRHNEVIDMCNEFTEIFTTIIMGQFLAAALLLCVSVMDLLFNTGIGVILYISYSIAALVQLFMYCIGGSLVNDSSLEISDAMYLGEWYKCDAETRKMILMIMMRAQRPTSVKVPFFSPSLSVFMSILSTTGSYIALMKSFI